MTAVLTSPAQIVNYCLKKAGSRIAIGSLYDGTDEARVALAVYGQIRDQLLATGEWDFAQRMVLGTLLKSAPQDASGLPSYIGTPWSPDFPALPWAYEYAYPDDAVQVRGVLRQPTQIPNFDPRFNRFEVANDDGYTPTEKVVLCNIPNAIVVYAGQITDPAQMNVAFVEALADRLAEPLALALTDLDHAKMATMKAQASVTSAYEERG